MRTIKVLVADDHVLMRDGLQVLLSRAFVGLVIEFSSGFAETAQRLLSWRENHQAAIVILDLRMPGMDGLRSVTQLLSLAAPHPVIVYSEVESSVTAVQLMQLGVFAVECKSAGVESLLQTVQRALNELDSDSIVMDYSNIPVSAVIAQISSVSLTARQMDMLRALHQGLPNKLIAREYGVALGTVKNHLFILYERLGVKSRSEALHKTREWFL